MTNVLYNLFFNYYYKMTDIVPKTLFDIVQATLIEYHRRYKPIKPESFPSSLSLSPSRSLSSTSTSFPTTTSLPTSLPEPPLLIPTTTSSLPTNSQQMIDSLKSSNILELFNNSLSLNTEDIYPDDSPDDSPDNSNTPLSTSSTLISSWYDLTYYECLIKVLKKHHMWPYLQVKKFDNDDNLVLLHNTYDNYNHDDVAFFKNLYEQCKCVVLDFSCVNNNHVVVSYANSIPERIDIEEYVCMENFSVMDKYQEAYDGTLMTVYNHNNVWHFGTTSCTDINNSKFGSKKSHGMMFDEILLTYFSSDFTEDELAGTWTNDFSEKLRNKFTSYLDPLIAYEFVIIHHENIHIIDYSNIHGNGYKILYHINSKNRLNLSEMDVYEHKFVDIGVKYPKYFEYLDDAYNYIMNNQSYGFIIRQNAYGSRKLFKISPDDITFRENTDPMKVNVWQNILAVYMKNNKNYKINDYISIYSPDIEYPYDYDGNKIDPTYLIHTTIISLQDFLYKLYVNTTTYDPYLNRFKFKKELDLQHAPIVRFHLAQIRRRQIIYNIGQFMKPKDIYYYICRCNNVNNIRLLINTLSSSLDYDFPSNTSLCLKILSKLL